jgi:hypothetical protein
MSKQYKLGKWIVIPYAIGDDVGTNQEDIIDDCIFCGRAIYENDLAVEVHLSDCNMKCNCDMLSCDTCAREFEKSQKEGVK